jgi:hypothetical protein
MKRQLLDYGLHAPKKLKPGGRQLAKEVLAKLQLGEWHFDNQV